MKMFKHVAVTACIALTAAGFAVAQDSSSLPYEQKIDLVYGEVHGTGLLMDVFTPKEKANGLAIVDVASGAWHSDRSKIRDHTLAQLYRIFCSHGYTVFALRPGSRTRYTGLEMANHVKMGIRYVKLHASEYKIDPDRLGLTGASAGGHLATLVAVTPEEGKPDASQPLQRLGTQVRAAAVFFPPTDFLDWNGKPANSQMLADLLFVGGIKGHTEEEIKERALQISPAQLVKKTPIPFLLIHGDADPLVPLQQSEKMVGTLKAAGGSAELIVKKGGGHPWMTLPEEVKIMADWFDQHLMENKSASPAAQK
ncbi:MAG: prolyl oligopeptidase family serine peptidase [Verrucomicrobia bacterium]|nr:prolyl oligopeptidase family serine peptidase [Verrucomicrobiota bacterium]